MLCSISQSGYVSAWRTLAKDVPWGTVNGLRRKKSCFYVGKCSWNHVIDRNCQLDNWNHLGHAHNSEGIWGYFQRGLAKVGRATVECRWCYPMDWGSGLIVNKTKQNKRPERRLSSRFPLCFQALDVMWPDVWASCTTSLLLGGLDCQAIAVRQ